MKSFIFKVKCLLLIAPILITTGCTTYVVNAKKLDGYDKTMSKVTVSWVNPTNLQTTIRKSGQGVTRISSADRDASNNGIRTLLSLFEEHGASLVSQELGNHSVTTVSGSETALHKITLTAVKAETECVPLGCTHNLKIHAMIVDVEINKIVWTASFFVGKPYADKSDEATLKNFVGSLIDELHGDKLI